MIWDNGHAEFGLEWGRIMVKCANSVGKVESGVDMHQILAKTLGNVKAIYIVHGYTDLRRSIDGLNITLEILRHRQEDECLYLFCGRRADRIKGLYRSNGRSALIVFREDDRRYHWPRKGNAVEKIDIETFLAIMAGEQVSFPSNKSEQ